MCRLPFVTPELILLLDALERDEQRKNCEFGRIAVQVRQAVAIEMGWVVLVSRLLHWRVGGHRRSGNHERKF
ncbi:hypothetical protein OKW39_008833 [Paraburkholderia sp. MM6662-R1]